MKDDERTITYYNFIYDEQFYSQKYHINDVDTMKLSIQPTNTTTYSGSSDEDVYD